MAQELIASIEAALEKAPTDLKKWSAADQFASLRARAETLMADGELRERLEQSKKSKKPLRIKYGIDPTRPEMHVGHLVPILLLRQFQRMGHTIVFIIGDFTATIGDPSGRVKERPVLTMAQVKENVRVYAKQASRFLDWKKTELHYNGEWFGKMKLEEFFSYLRLQTVATAMQREDFRKRGSITRAELLYATLQAIDSVKIKADIEIGGKDQLLNLLEGRELMQRLDMRPQSVLTLPLLPGLSGTGIKMSKTEGGTIALLDSAEEVFGKVMSVPDQDMKTYFKLLAEISDEQWQKIEAGLKKGELHPKVVKQLLARRITTLLHPKKSEVLAAEKKFAETFSEHKTPKDVPIIRLAKDSAKDLVDVLMLAKVAPSRSEAKRLIKGNGVSLLADAQRETVTSIASLQKKSEFVLQIGKRHFIKIKWK
jgi:tyrosyl-tRNA synthetase